MHRWCTCKHEMGVTCFCTGVATCVLSNVFELGLLAPKDPKAEHISNSDCVRHFKCIIMKKGCNVSQLDRRRELMTKPCPLAVIRNRRLNSVALLVPLRSVQFSSVQFSSDALTARYLRGMVTESDVQGVPLLAEGAFRRDPP